MFLCPNPPPQSLAALLGVLLFLRAGSRLPDVLIRESWAVVSYGRFHIKFESFAVRATVGVLYEVCRRALREPYVGFGFPMKGDPAATGPHRYAPHIQTPASGVGRTAGAWVRSAPQSTGASLRWAPPIVYAVRAGVGRFSRPEPGPAQEFRPRQ
jgi:hypothetical protein